MKKIKKGSIINGDAYCYCGRKTFPKGKNLLGENIFTCPDGHTLKDSDFKVR